MGWYGNLKIRNKLFTGYAVIAALSCVIAYFGVSGMRDLKAFLDDTHENQLHSIVFVTDADRHSQHHKREVLRYLSSAGKDLREETAAGIRREEGDMKKVLADLETMPLLPREREMLSSMRAAWSAYLEAASRAMALADAGNSAGAWDAERRHVAPLFKELEDLTERMRSFNVEESDEHYTGAAQAYARLRLLTAALSMMLVGLSLAAALAITRSVTVPLNKGLEVVRSLATGGADKARVTEAIANGDLSQNITPSEPLVIDAANLNADETGALLKSIIRMSETQTTLYRAFARLTVSLRRSREEEQKNDWLKTGLNELNVLMRGDQKASEMADRVLTFLSGYLNAGAGAFYLYDGTGEVLALTATYAFTRRKNLGDRFRPGEGLIGQAALEKKMICLENVPRDYLTIGSALGEATPRNVAALPLVHNDQLVAALELGTFAPFTDGELDFLSRAAESIAIGLGVALSRQRISELLEKTQQQTEELRVQQEELQQSNEELEERAEMLEEQGKQIRLKNQEIETASAELKRKAADLEQVSAYKSEFMANMSHELRTPLNSMMLLSTLLMENREKTLTDRQREYAATIHSSGKDLQNLINDILDLSKVEAGRLELHYEDVPVKAFCGALESLFQPQAVQKGLQFTIETDPAMPETMHIDEQRTLQVVKNLLANAVKFTEKGSIALHLSAPPGAASPLAVPALAFRVSDTGIGIPADKHDLVFQAFQQANGGAGRKYGGTGLGLSISLQLARRMGGDITLASEKDKGSVFTLYLPFEGKAAEGIMPPEPPAVTISPAAPPAQAARPVPAEESSEGLARPRPLPDDRDRLKQGEKSILVIEDDLNFARTLMTMVREKGFGCIVAADGASGIHLADLYLPSAIILDVILPGIDGWSVMRSLKSSPRTRHIPVHFITCLDERQKAMSMGAVGFLTKPVSPEQLEEAFDTIEKAAAKEVKKLLIIEDNPGEAEGMAGLLRSRDCEISIAATGREAIGLLGRGQVDCIVLDLGLSDMSGFDLLEHIHQSADLRSVPVIIHTGRDLSHEEEIKLQRYAKSIIIKGAKSPERLLNEVTLFLHMVESDLPPEKQRMIRSAVDREAMLEGKKVLIVDDDMRNVFSLSSVLSDKSMAVIEAENGKEALARLEEYPDVNIVLMDIMMPEMDGYEAMHAIRGNPRFKDLPVIAMTAKAFKGEQEKCLQAGANDYITKPLDVEKLLSLLRVWLYRPGVKPEAA